MIQELLKKLKLVKRGKGRPRKMPNVLKYISLFIFNILVALGLVFAYSKLIDGSNSKVLGRENKVLVTEPKRIYLSDPAMTKGFLYEVKENDSLQSIAIEFYYDINKAKDLEEHNDLAYVDGKPALKKGQKLFLPILE